MINDFLFVLSDDRSEAPLLASSLALLSLKRLLRGTFQQIGIALVAMIFVLNLTGQPADRVLRSQNILPSISPSSISPSTATPSAPVYYPHTQSLPPAPKETVKETAAPESAAGETAQELSHLLRSRLTYHRLTTARLALPAADKRMVASLDNAE